MQWGGTGSSGPPPAARPAQAPKPSGFVPNTQPINQVYVRAIKELAVPYPAVTLPGFRDTNILFGGFREKEYTILCGPTGCGKTTLLSNWSKSLCMGDTRHVVFSVETGETDYVKRIMSAFVGRDMNTGDSIPTDIIRKFDEDHGRYFRGDLMHLGLYDRHIKAERLIQELEWHRVEKRCKIAFVDNMNYLLNITDEKSERGETDRVTRLLIDYSKKSSMHIVMVMHPRKTEHGRVEHEFDIKGSSTAPQEANNVLLFNPPSLADVKAERAAYGNRELKFQKMRRRGFHVGKRLILECQGATYSEAKVYDWYDRPVLL